MKKIILLSFVAIITSCSNPNNKVKSENKETTANPIVLKTHKIHIEIKDEKGNPVDGCYVWFAVSNYIDWRKMAIDKTGIIDFCENDISSTYYLVIFRDAPKSPIFHYTFSESKLDSDKNFVLVQNNCK
jgi:hypothetical protein